MQRFFTIIGLLTTVALMILGINSILPQGGFIVVDGERIGTWVPNEPAITLPVIEDHSPHDIELTLPDPVGPATSLYYTAIDYIEAKDGIEGSDDFYRACEDPDNLRRSAYFCDLAAIVAAIRYAEDGGPGREYGALSAYAKDTTYRKQAGECAFSVQANWDRYLKGGPCLNQINGGKCKKKHKPGDSRDMQSYIYYFSHVYCPVDADNDPDGLNKNHPKNVLSHYNRILTLSK